MESHHRGHVEFHACSHPSCVCVTNLFPHAICFYWADIIQVMCPKRNNFGISACRQNAKSDKAQIKTLGALLQAVCLYGRKINKIKQHNVRETE